MRSAHRSRRFFLPTLAGRALRCTAVALVALASLTADAADLEGKTGRVVRMTVNSQASEKYASFHGAVVLRRSGGNREETYRWGGSSCPGQKLTDAQVDMLMAAMHNRHKTLVAPRYAEGEGQSGSRCLVSFDLVAG